MIHEFKTKLVIDSDATMTDAMNNMRNTIVLVIIANTARHRQLAEIGEWLDAEIEEAVKANSFIVSIGDETIVFDGFCFDVKWNHAEWFNKISEMLSLLSKNDCWYEDRISNGFCWENLHGCYCKLEWK